MLSSTLIAITLVASNAPLRAHRVEPGTIVVDGTNGDQGWKRPAFAGFVQYEPSEGVAPTEPTVAKAAYDGEAFYVIVEARDSEPEQIRGQLTRRDASSPSDWLHVWLDTYDDDRTAYRFSVNPAGVQQDARLFDENEDVNWNAVWEAKTQTSSTGWTAEFRIPFSQLRYDASHDRWGIQVGRDLSRNQEKSFLAPTPRGTNRLAAHFAELSLEGELPAARGLVVSPYATGGIAVDAGDTNFTGTVGGALDWALGSALSLSLTVNPDFGQVEADPSVLNLSAFEVFLKEQRPFFLEGREMLHFPLAFGDGELGAQSLFYSRRIGRAPTGDPLARDGEEVIDRPTSTNILGAAKLTGKTPDGWSIAALDAVVGPADATLRGPTGARTSPVAALTNAAVLRLSKDLRGGQTRVGLMTTHLYRDLDGGLEDQMVRNAFTAGADVHHRFGELQLMGRVFGSHVAGTSAAIESLQTSGVHLFQREDAEHVSVDATRESMSGYGFSTMFGKLSGKHWRGAVGALVQSPGFEPNDLGFLQRADSQMAFLWGQVREDEPGPLHRTYQVNTNLWGSKTFGDEVTSVGGNVNLWWQFPNMYAMWMGGGRNVEALDVSGLRGGPAFLQPGRWYGWAGGSTDPRAKIVVEVESWAHLEDTGLGSGLGGKVALSFRPTSALELSLTPNVNRFVSDTQYVATTDRPIIGHLEQTTVQMAARANWTFTPRLSLQVYVAPFVSSGTYENFRTTADVRAERYADRFEAVDFDGDEEFTFVQLRANVVLRWEYALGSTVFLVWSRGQTDSAAENGSLQFGPAIERLASAPAEDRVMLKIGYWLPI